MGQTAQRGVLKTNGELIWHMRYFGEISHDTLPTVEDFQRDLELLKEDIEQMSPLG